MPGVRLRRDGITWQVYAVYGAFGWFLYAYTPSVTLLRDQEHISDAVAGLHGTGYALGVVAVGAVADRILAVTGRDLGLWLFAAGLCTGIGLYLAAPILPLTLAASVILGGSGAGLLSTAGAAMSNHHREGGPAAITEGNALAAALGLIAPLMIAASVHLGFGWRPALAVPAVAFVVLFATRHRFGSGLDTTIVYPTHAEQVTRSDRRLGRAYWLSWSFLVLCTGIEFCLTLWSGQFLHDRTGLSTSTAATGVTAVVAGLAVGRVAGVRLARRHAVDTLLVGALVTNLVGFFVFWTAPVAWVGFAGLAVCGLGIALQYPMGLGRAINTVTGAAGADRASAWLTLGTGISIGFAPFLLGFLADTLTITKAFLVVPLLIVAAGVALILAHRESVPTVEPKTAMAAAEAPLG